MGIELAKKQLQLQKIICSFTPIHIQESGFTTCLKQYAPCPGQVIVWAIQAVSFGYWNGSRMILVNKEINQEDILELRVWNESEELHLLRDGDEFYGRQVIDGTGDEQYVVDSFARLWGQKTDGEAIPEGYIRLCDKNRGLELMVPYKGEMARELGLTTRNYIGYDIHTGLAGYNDYRFVSIDAAREV